MDNKNFTIPLTRIFKAFLELMACLANKFLVKFVSYQFFNNFNYSNLKNSSKILNYILQNIQNKQKNFSSSFLLPPQSEPKATSFVFFLSLSLPSPSHPLFLATSLPPFPLPPPFPYPFARSGRTTRKHPGKGRKGTGERREQKKNERD